MLGRFINGDGYASTGQGFLGFNMFAYCNNDPVANEDPTGKYIGHQPTIVNDGGSKYSSEDLKALSDLKNNYSEVCGEAVVSAYHCTSSTSTYHSTGISNTTQNILEGADGVLSLTSTTGGAITTVTTLAKESCPVWLSTGSAYLFVAAICVKAAKAATNWVVDSCKTPGLPSGDYTVASFDLTISRHSYINGATNDWETTEYHQVINIFTSKSGSRFYHCSYYEVNCLGRRDYE